MAIDCKHSACWRCHRFKLWVLVRGNMRWKTVISGNVAAADFAGEPGFECFDGVGVLAEEFDALAAGAALPTPLPHQRGIAKQAWLDRQHIVARHVAGGVMALEDDEGDGVGRHVAVVARAMVMVQFKF